MNNPRWYYGWNIVAAATLLTLLTVGMRLGIGPFFLPMAEDLGFSRSLLATIIGIGMLCYGLAMPLAGYLVGRLGTRAVLLMGTAIVIASTIWTVMARTPITFLLSFGVLLSIGLAFTSPVALTPVISRWFTRQRGMALFFLSTGSMAGMALMTPLLTLSIERFDWQTTLLCFAVAFAVGPYRRPCRDPRRRAGTPTCFPSSAGSPAAAREAALAGLTFSAAIRTSPFWKIVFGLFACGFSMNLLGTHGMPMLMDHGFDAMTSSYGIGLIGLVAIAGTLILGRFSDRVPGGISLPLFISSGAWDSLRCSSWAPTGSFTSRPPSAVWSGPAASRPPRRYSRTSTACGWSASCTGPPTWVTRSADHQLMAGRVGIRALRHALGCLRRLGSAFAAGRSSRAATAPEGRCADAAGSRAECPVRVALLPSAA